MVIKNQKSLKLKGLDNVLKNLNKEVLGIRDRTRKGLRAVGLFIQDESMEMAPSDFGVLRKSAFSNVSVSGSMITARIGYTAKYAAAVHEFPMTLKGKPRAHFGKTGTQSAFGPTQIVAFGGGSEKGTYWDNGENKFLEKPVKNNMKKIPEIIQKRAKIK